jgi:hypothetical protein
MGATRQFDMGMSIPDLRHSWRSTWLLTSRGHRPPVSGRHQEFHGGLAVEARKGRGVKREDIENGRGYYLVEHLPCGGEKGF